MISYVYVYVIFTMFLENIKTTDFDPNRKYTFVIPMGATEQHGPFLPTGTDSFLMDHIIRDCEGFFPEIVFLPTLRYTDASSRFWCEGSSAGLEQQYYICFRVCSAEPGVAQRRCLARRTESA